MSRIAAAAYQIDLTVMSMESGDGLRGEPTVLWGIVNRLETPLDAVLWPLLLRAKDDEQKQKVNIFLLNGLLLRAEALGWLGQNKEMRDVLEKSPSSEMTEASALAGTQLASAVCALTNEDYADALEAIKRDFETRLQPNGGECSGKVAAILVVACRRLNRATEAEDYRNWILSSECHEDAGNGLAKDWARRIA